MTSDDAHPDLFADAAPDRIELATDAVLLKAFALDGVGELLAALSDVVAAAPFRHFVTPGGHTMSVAMTNCGQVGWLSDRKGYRYGECDPASGKNWPAMPRPFRALAQRAAAEVGFAGFDPDACLINRYDPGSRLSLHQASNEQDMSAPIVSVSLGLPAKFLFGGLLRSERPQRGMLHHGDMVVWGGRSRMAYHGIDTLKDGHHSATGRCRINLTFRKAL